MSMSVGTDYTSNYAYSTTNAVNSGVKKDETEEKKTVGAKTDDSTGVVFEKSSEKIDNSTYSINKMSKSDRTAIANQLKAAADQRQQQLISIVQKSLNGQVSAYGKATGNNIWHTLASGNFTVDDVTRSQAQKDISEDGYWGVKQTSQRLFDFASALAGDDVEKMKEMQAAMEKGFKQATKTWGRE
ncbi:MAG: hypothetical protein J5476_00740, partial [Lachnospiraceae bacterium]|nr:hypothetical protein [Lachnospiraceae bacterium]